MTRATHSFYAEVLSPASEQPVDAEITYRMADVGVLPERHEWRALLVSVVPLDGADLLAMLDADATAQLERQCAEHWHDEMTHFNGRDHRE